MYLYAPLYSKREWNERILEKHVVSFRRKMIFSGLFSLLFSFLMVLGYSFSKTYSFQFFDTYKAFISFCVISLIAFGIMYAVLSRINVPKESELSKSCRKVRHPFFSAWVLIIVAWIPYYAIFAPGLGFYDSLWQLSQFYGYTSILSILSWQLLLLVFYFQLGNRWEQISSSLSTRVFKYCLFPLF